MILLLDNYDSFTYNLAQYLGELGCEVEVHRNDKITVDDIVRRYGSAPKDLLVDTHYATVADIAALGSREKDPVRVFAPLPQEKETITPRAMANRRCQREREPQCVKEWRSRMETGAGQDTYRRRKLMERINGHTKNCGFGILPVRGLIKAKAVALLHALANNLMAAHRLRLRAT